MPSTLILKAHRSDACGHVGARTTQHLHRSEGSHRRRCAADDKSEGADFMAQLHHRVTLGARCKVRGTGRKRPHPAAFRHAETASEVTTGTILRRVPGRAHDRQDIEPRRSVKSRRGRMDRDRSVLEVRRAPALRAQMAPDTGRPAPRWRSPFVDAWSTQALLRRSIPWAFSSFWRSTTTASST